MPFGLGLGLGLGRWKRYGGGGAAPAFSIPDSAWSMEEAPADVDTRKVIVTVLKSALPVALPVGKGLIFYRGDDGSGVATSGNYARLVDIGSAYQYQATGPVSLTGPSPGRDYVRLGIADAGGSPVPYNNPSVQMLSSVKEFVSSNVPDAADFTQLADGTGTAVSIFLEPPIENGRTVAGGRYRINGGSWVTHSGIGQIDLTGQPASFTFGFQWQNANGYSIETSQTVYASLPTYTSAMVALNGLTDEDGTHLEFDISSHPTPPDAATLLETEYRLSTDGGSTWTDWAPLPEDGIVTTDAEAETDGQLRAVYDFGYSIPGDTVTGTPVQDLIEVEFIGYAENTGSSTSPTGTIPTHQTNDLLIFEVAHDSTATVTAPPGFHVVDPAPSPNDNRIHIIWGYAPAPGTTVALTLSTSRSWVWKCKVYRKARDIVVGTAKTQTNNAAPDAPSFDFGDVERVYATTLVASQGNANPQTAAPSGGWGDFDQTISGGTTAHVRLSDARMILTGTDTVPAVTWGAALGATAAWHTVSYVVRPGEPSMLPSVAAVGTLTGVMAEGEVLTWTNAIYVGPPVPTVTTVLEKTNNGGSSYSAVTPTGDGFYLLDDADVGYQFRLRNEASNDIGAGPSSATALTVAVAAAPGLLAVQTITEGDVTMEVAGLAAWGWTEDRVFCGVPATTNYTILSITPDISAGEGGRTMHGQEKNPGTTNNQGFDQRVSGPNASTIWSSDYFVSSMITRCPVRMTGTDTFLKSVGVYPLTQENSYGIIKQFLGAYVSGAAPGVGDFAPNLFHFSGRATETINIDVEAEVAAIPRHTLPTTGKSFTLSTDLARFVRFNPGFGRFQQATGNANSMIFLINRSAVAGRSNYGEDMAEMNANMALSLHDNTVNDTDRRAIYVQFISRGIQWDTSKGVGPDGGIFQYHQYPMAIARGLRGISVSDMRTVRPGNWLGQIFQWTPELIALLVPHNSLTGPGPRNFVRRTVTAVAASGSQTRITFSKLTTDKFGMPVAGLLVWRESDGQFTYAVEDARTGDDKDVSGIGNNSDANNFRVYVDTQTASPISVGNVCYFPPPDLPEEGDPDWCTRFSESELESYNASPSASYRSINRWEAQYGSLKLQGLWPDDWVEMDDFAKRLKTLTYPTSGAYRFTRRSENEWGRACMDALWTQVLAA